MQIYACQYAAAMAEAFEGIVSLLFPSGRDLASASSAAAAAANPSGPNGDALRGTAFGKRGGGMSAACGVL